MNPPHSIIKGWSDVILRSLEIATGEPTLRLGPPMVARLLAMVYTAAFQAWAPTLRRQRRPSQTGHRAARPRSGPRRTSGSRSVSQSTAPPST